MTLDGGHRVSHKGDRHLDFVAISTPFISRLAVKRSVLL